MRIDAHQHLWTVARGDYGWLTPEAGVLYADFAAEDLKPLIDAAGVDATIVVQAAETEAETHFLLAMAAANPWIRGVVGWTDLSAPGAALAVAKLAEDELLVGLRPMLQDLADPNWVLRTEVEPGLRATAEAGVVFDALVRAPQRHVVAELARRHPDLAIVLDHAAKPAIGEGVTDEWRRAIAEAAAQPNVAVKLSGLLTEGPAGISPVDLAPFVTVLLDTFGPGRILWGSDWPVLLLASDYARWSAMTDEMLADLPDADVTAIRGGNAARIYLKDRT